MSRLWSTGFELGTLANTVEITGVTSPAPTIDTGTIRYGSYSMKVIGTGSSNVATYNFKASNTLGNFYFRFYLRVAARPTGATTICPVFTVASTTGNKIGVCMDTSGRLFLQNLEDTLQIGSVSAALTLNTWYRVELNVNTTTLASTQVTGLIDGTSFASGSANLAAGVAVIQVGINSSSDGTFYYDDLAINDNSGTVQNSYPGSGAIVHMQVDSAGDSNEWATGAGGTAGAANNYTRIKEVTPDDLTSYNIRNATGLADTTFFHPIDDFNLESSASAGIGVSDPINLVAVGVRISANSSTATNRKGVLRIKGQSSGTLQKSLSFGWNSTGFNTNAIAHPRNYQLTAYVNPQTGLAWTPATLDTMQIGYQPETSSTNQIWVTNIWALVEYQPTTPPTTFTKDHTTNSILKKSPLLTHSTDSLKKITVLKTHTTNSNLKATSLKTHSTNSLLHNENSKTHTTDSYLSNALNVFTIEHYIDSLLRGAYTISHDTYSTLKIAKEALHTTDSFIRAAVTKTHTTNSILKTSPTLAHTTDSLIRLSSTLFHTMDSLLLKSATLTHTTDSSLYKFNVFLLSHTTSSNLVIETFGAWSDIWDYTVVNFTLTHTTNSFLATFFRVEHTTDSYLTRAQTTATNNLPLLGVS